MKFSDIDLLSILEREEYKGLRTIFRKRHHSKGEILCRPDEPENLVFILVSGRVRVFLAYEEKEFTLAFLERGDIYSTHTPTFVEVLEDSEILVGEIHLFREQLNEFPVFMPTMIRVLGNMLHNSFAIIESLAFWDVKKRLVELLLKEANRSGERKGKEVIFLLGLTMEQLSRLVGASRQTVSTLINELMKAGVLEKTGRSTYRIPDIEQFEHTTLQE